MQTLSTWITSPYFVSGFLLPAMISAALLLHVRKAPPYFFMLTIIGAVMTVLLEAFVWNADLGIFLFAAYPIGYVILKARSDPTLRNDRLEPAVAFYGSFASLLISDVAAAAITGFPLQYLGGMGLMDGLVLYPSIAALICYLGDREANRNRAVVAA